MKVDKGRCWWEGRFYYYNSRERKTGEGERWEIKNLF